MRPPRFLLYEKVLTISRMETDMSPIDDSYDPVPQTTRGAPMYFQGDQEQEYYPPPPQQPVFIQQPEKKGGFFAQLDTTTWLIIGLLVLIAFFMGKTMQPVIIRG